MGKFFVDKFQIITNQICDIICQVRISKDTYYQDKHVSRIDTIE